MLVNLCKTFVCRWMAVNQFIYYLHSAEKKRRGCVGGNGGGSLAALLASLLAGMVEWPGIH